MFHLIDHAVKIFWRGALAYTQVEGIERNTTVNEKWHAQIFQSEIINHRTINKNNLWGS